MRPKPILVSFTDVYPPMVLVNPLDWLNVLMLLRAYDDNGPLIAISAATYHEQLGSLQG